MRHTELKSNTKVLNDFCEMTGASQSQAKGFLARTYQNFQKAINLFFDEGALPEVKKLKSTKEIDCLFDQLATNNGEVKQIDEEKFSQFIETYFKVEEENLIIPHILINIMKVPKSGHLQIQHFYNLFLHLGCESPRQLPKYLPLLHQQIYHNQLNFKSLYTNTYPFYLCGKDTTLDYDIAVQIWKLYLKKKMSFYQDFIEYCETVPKKPKKVHKDLWKMVYQFSLTIKNISTVKEDDGWPVFLDDFVDYLKAKSNKMEQ